MAESVEKKREQSGMTRRQLCAGIGGAAALLALGGLRFAPSDPLVRPPGGQDENALLASCIRCEKCVEVCPRNAIKLSHIENGIVSMRTPEMNFYKSWCDFCVEENGGVPLCAATCATGALKLPAGGAIDANASGVEIGKAWLKEDWCLAYHGTGCHVCYDACPYGAMGLDENHRPYVIPEICNGCGACEAVCVSLTNGSRSIAPDANTRAIVVVPSQKAEALYEG